MQCLIVLFRQNHGFIGPIGTRTWMLKMHSSEIIACIEEMPNVAAAREKEVDQDSRGGKEEGDAR